MIDEAGIAFLCVATFAVFLVGLSKAAFGGMLSTLATPMVATVSDILTAVAVLLPAYMVADVVVACLYLRDVRWDVFRPMALAGLAGVAAGAFVFQALDPTWLQAALGTLSIAWAALFGLRQLRAAEPASAPRSGHWLRTLGWCGPTGMLSYFLMAGPPAQFYLLPFRLAPAAYVAVMVWFFAVVNWAKMPVMAGLGVVTLDTLKLTALLLPALPLGIWAGKRINARIAAGPFYAAVHILLLALGTYLVVGAFLA